MTSLEDLNMTSCTRVVSLPESFCRLRKLKKLNLSGGSTASMKLESLPARFGELKKLREIDFSWCEQLHPTVIFDVVHKFKGLLVKLSLRGLKIKSLPQCDPFVYHL